MFLVTLLVLVDTEIFNLLGSNAISETLDSPFLNVGNCKPADLTDLVKDAFDNYNLVIEIKDDEE